MSIKFLTQSYPTEKSLFLIPKFVLRIVGFYPEQEKSTIRRNAWTMFNLIMLIYGSYAEFMYGVHYLSIDAVRALDALCPVASSIMSVLKLSLLWWHRVELERLIRRVSVLTAEQDSRLKNNYNRRYFTIATRFSAALLCLGTCTSTLYTIRAALANYFSYVRGENVPYETPFKMIFPQTLLSKWIFPSPSHSRIGMAILPLRDLLAQMVSFSVFFSDYGILLYFVHALAVTTELFLYGIGGTTVIECSSQLATAVYDSNWYSHNVEVKKWFCL
ncbi:unnamed protein product [Ceratitis capitata]|uniref:(Mediterranean fruit fly) hypothetical protein n=1 Tax=Ceratitis capitata TaxID=7213 RepID=A0A811UUJ2_CERCA|nr:unnamed protein product [Ceratitis capitata]